MILPMCTVHDIATVQWRKVQLSLCSLSVFYHHVLSNDSGAYVMKGDQGPRLGLVGCS